MIDFGEAVRQFYGNYINADGRAQRSAYWWVQLYRFIIITVLFIVFLMAEGGPELIENLSEILKDETIDDYWANLGPSGKASVFALLLFGLVNFIPKIMLDIRRFHDLGHTGWFVFPFLVLGNLHPIGFFVTVANLVWFAYPGTRGPNQYGPDPLGHNTDIFG